MSIPEDNIACPRFSFLMVIRMEAGIPEDGIRVSVSLRRMIFECL